MIDGHMNFFALPKGLFQRVLLDWLTPKEIVLLDSASGSHLNQSLLHSALKEIEIFPQWHQEIIHFGYWRGIHIWEWMRSRGYHVRMDDYGTYSPKLAELCRLIDHEDKVFPFIQFLDMHENESIRNNLGNETFLRKLLTAFPNIQALVYNTEMHSACKFVFLLLKHKQLLQGMRQLTIEEVTSSRQESHRRNATLLLQAMGKQLQTLNLTIRSAAYLSNLPSYCPRLQELSVRCRAPVSPEDLLRCIGAFRPLSKLDVRFPCPSTADDSFALRVAQLQPHLRSLVLHGDGFSLQALEHVLSRCPDVQHVKINMHHCEFRRAERLLALQLPHCCESLLPSLGRVLRLAGEVESLQLTLLHSLGLPDESSAFASQLRALLLEQPALRRLEVNAGVWPLLAPLLSSLPRLRSLRLRYEMRDVVECGAVLRQLCQHGGNVEELEVENGDQLDDEAAAQLLDHLPRLRSLALRSATKLSLKIVEHAAAAGRAFDSLVLCNLAVDGLAVLHAAQASGLQIKRLEVSLRGIFDSYVLGHGRVYIPPNSMARLVQRAEDEV